MRTGVALWETNRGCPFSCSYCVWGASTNKRVYQRDTSELYREIDWFSRNKIEFIFCCDANFGILHRDIQLAEPTQKTKVNLLSKSLFLPKHKNSTIAYYNLYKTLSDQKLNKGFLFSNTIDKSGDFKEHKRENISLDTFNELQKIQRIRHRNFHRYYTGPATRNIFQFR